MSKNWDNIFESLAQRRATWEEYETTYHANTVTPADKQSFREWSDHRSFSSMQAKLTPPPKDALVKPFSRIIFHSTQDPVYTKWLNDMSHPTQLTIPLGRTTKAFYQLRPGPRGLRADNEDRDEEYLGRHPHFDIKDSVFLGVNTNRPTEPAPAPHSVDSREEDRRKEQRSDESTVTTDTEEGANGFVFHQLGSLESAMRVPGATAAADDPTACIFSHTGFFVVARIGPSGTADGLFIILDKFPANYEEDLRPDVPEQETGTLAHEEDVAGISMARLDGSCCLLEGREFSTPVTWTGKVRSPIELVYARQRTAGHGLVRLTVFDDFVGG